MADAGHYGDAETMSWVDLYYIYPIEELTFGGLLSRGAAARVVIPAMFAAVQQRLLRLAVAYPDLARIDEARAAVFAEREWPFHPKLATHLAAVRRTGGNRVARPSPTTFERPPRSDGSTKLQRRQRRMDSVSRQDGIRRHSLRDDEPADPRAVWSAMTARSSFVTADI